MKRLSARDRELTAIGSAIGSNCISCVEFHIPEARKAGLDDHEILQAVRLADEVRRFPASKVLDRAQGLLNEEKGDQPDETATCAGSPEIGCCDDRGTIMPSAG